MIESPKTIADRIKKVLAVVPPERVTLSTDCGMKPLARMVAKMKLKALADGAAMVRSELVGTR
jgi:5-methyltetrahydropteroyltriglutamate--homocysteine methyltransferase